LRQITYERKSDNSVVENIGPIIGVKSKDKSESIIKYQNLTHHDEWRFIFYPKTKITSQPLPTPPNR